MEIIIIVLALAALAFATLWWRDRHHVAVAERARDHLAKEALEDAQTMARLRESGRRAAEKIAELEPLAARERRAQAQRVAASHAAAAARHAEAEAKKAAAK